MIDDYASEFDRWLVGSAAEKAEWRAELVAHLHEADEAGELDGALARLGRPKVAAQEFSCGRELKSAAIGRRMLASVVDYAPLLAVSVGLLLESILSRGSAPPVPSWYPFIAGHGIWAAFPPVLQFDPGEGWLEMIGVPLALAWSIVGVAYVEATTGLTPGKRLCQIRTVSEGGIAVTLGQALLRRLSLLFGVYACLDWLPVVGRRRQRILERLARTRVVEDPARSLTPARPPLPQ